MAERPCTCTVVQLYIQIALACQYLTLQTVPPCSPANWSHCWPYSSGQALVQLCHFFRHAAMLWRSGAKGSHIPGPASKVVTVGIRILLKQNSKNINLSTNVLQF